MARGELTFDFSAVRPIKITESVCTGSAHISTARSRGAGLGNLDLIGRNRILGRIEYTGYRLLRLMILSTAVLIVTLVGCTS